VAGQLLQPQLQREQRAATSGGRRPAATSTSGGQLQLRQQQLATAAEYCRQSAAAKWTCS